MRIVLEHRAVIPPRRYGGTERVIAWLARGLLELGHEITLISEPPPAGETPPESFRNVRQLPWTPDWLERQRATLEKADALHLWGPPSSETRYPCPVLVTIQGNGKPGEAFHPNTVFVSRDHAERHGGKYFVYNGLDPAEWIADTRRRDHLVFLAKAAWKVKNLAGAIEVARAVGAPLEVLGSRSLPLEIQRLLPRFGGVRYHGMVDDDYKRRILRDARALLFPVRWPEPFGIAMTEALASGCAVLGTPYGSLPEIVTPEVGLLSARASDLVAWLRAGQAPRPEICRKRVIDHFSYLTMTHAYLDLYARVAGGRTLHPESDPPRARGDAAPENLLPWISL